MRKMRVYLAKKMSGLSGRELVEDSFLAAQICPHAIELFDPVAIEGVKPDQILVAATEEALRGHWQRDKQAIRNAHVIIDTTGRDKSAGVEAEIGYARFFLYKPVIRVWPKLGPSIARIEGDAVVESLADAYAVALIRWGTPWKRLLWRVKLLKKLPKAIYYKSREWWNVIA